MNKMPPEESRFAGVDFLHIGKTGGSALRATLRPCAESCRLRLHGHDVTLADIPAGGRVLFSVREPLSRFASGFNSRLRKGRPHTSREWTPQEREAFARFATPNALAEALSGPNDLYDHAREAMGAIYHTARSLAHWLGSADYLVSRRRDIVWIGHQPELNADFERLGRLLALPDDVRLPADPVAMHRTPPGFDTHLSDRATANLRSWYAGDFFLYDSAMAIRESLIATRP